MSSEQSSPRPAPDLHRVLFHFPPGRQQAEASEARRPLGPWQTQDLSDPSVLTPTTSKGRMSVSLLTTKVGYCDPFLPSTGS